jgi:hypothetical protein
MKTWYTAICRKCGEGEHVFVSNPGCTAAYLGEKDREIQAFMEKHYGCSLELIWRDDQLDDIFNSGWKIRVSGDGCRYYKSESKTHLEIEGTLNV